MKLVILTSLERGGASRCLPLLCSTPGLQVLRVVLAHQVSANRRRAIQRRLKKIWKIGLLGALNGVRMREWYRDKEARDIHEVCRELSVELIDVDFMNSDQTVELLKDADLGLSLGCGYIGRRVFETPRFGIINLHTEVLPRFRTGSIVWPIHEGVKETGFTIHQVDAHLDTGNILFQKKYPIKFYPTLRETVEQNLLVARQQVPDAFAYVCSNYERLAATASPQGAGITRTTPTFWQYLKMLKNHRRFYQESLQPGIDRPASDD